MRATIELNVEAFDEILVRRGWSTVQAANEIGIARSSIHRLRKKEMGLSGDLIGAILVGLSRTRQRPEALFTRLFIVTNPTKE